MTTPYCTLAQAKLELRADTTVADDTLMSRIQAVSARIDGLFSSRSAYFAPTIETRTIIVRGDLTDSYLNTLRLPAPLLELTGITLNGTSLTPSTDVAAYPSALYPVWELRLKDTGNTWFTRASNTADYPRPIAAVTGIWGYHENYTTAWAAVDVASAIASTSATTFTVADVDGDDPWGTAPRISRGALLKIDSEFMEVADTATTTNTVTVRRGVNGSTAATHSASAPVSVWQVEPNVNRACIRQAALLMARRGSFEASVFTEVGTNITYPQDLLAELRGALQTYVYSGL